MSAPTKPDNPAPGEDVFTEEDLVPTAEPLRASNTIEKTATTVAVLGYGLVAGGMIALGACAAPFVFRLTPPPLSGHAMGAAFSRFDMIAVVCAVVGLAAEIARTIVSLRTKRAAGWIARTRRYAAILFAAATVYTATQLSPEIVALHAAGVRRDVSDDPESARLESTHQRAELVGKVVVGLAALLVGLHVASLGATPGATREDDDEALAPLPPGPRSS